jgi:hypothetical protein
MAVIYVRSIDQASGAEVPGSGIRTGSPRAAVDHAIALNKSDAGPGRVTRILYSGSFVDDAFTELAQLAQMHGLEVDNGEG